jgi:hypothetical protein
MQFRGDRARLLRDAYRLRRAVGRVRRAAWPLRKVVSALVTVAENRCADAYVFAKWPSTRSDMRVDPG